MIPVASCQTGEEVTFVATQLEELKLDDAHATAVLEKAKEFGAYNEDVPDTKKARISAANDQIAFCIDSWVNDEVTPDSDNEEIAEAGEQIAELLELAGVEIDEDGEVEYGELPELDDADDDDDDDNGDDDEDDESAFDPDQYIKGYTELSAAGKVKALKKLDLDDDDDVATIESIYEWEEEQDKPSSRVLAWVDEVLPADDDDSDDDSDDDDDADDADDDAADDDDDSDDDDDADDDDSDDDESEEPWEGYDKATAVDVKKVLDKANDDGDLTAEQVEYVKEYEEAKERPRKRILDHCDKLIEALADDDDDDEAEPEEKPAKKASGRGAKKGRGKKSADPDDDNDVDEAVANDDDKERNGKKTRVSGKSAKAKGVYYTVTVDVDDSTLEIVNEGVFATVGVIADLLMAGATSIEVEVG